MTVTPEIIYCDGTHGIACPKCGALVAGPVDIFGAAPTEAEVAELRRRAEAHLCSN